MKNCFNICLMFNFILLGCGANGGSDYLIGGSLAEKSSSKDYKNDSDCRMIINKSNFNDTIQIENPPFSLLVITEYINDTLIKEDSYNENCRVPIVKNQYLVFLKNGKVNKDIHFKFSKSIKRSTTGGIIYMPDIQLWKACLLKGNINDLYSVHGSGFCIGINCPEVVFYYSMTGDIVFEGYSGSYDMDSLKVILNENGIYNNCNIMKRIDRFW